MTARRTFLKATSIGSAALAMPPVAGAEAGALPTGKLCILVYGRSGRRLPDGAQSTVVVVDVPAFSLRSITSPVQNLHGLLEVSPGQLWGIGHESPERIDVFDRNFNRSEVRVYPGISFRGHGIRWGDGYLIAAEKLAAPMTGGVLVHMDSKGRLLGEFSSGGLRPHEIVRSGDHLAVAHYGHRAGQGQGATPQPPATDSMLFDTISPGVSFLDSKGLAQFSFHQTPGAPAITHLAPTDDGQVLAMGINTYRASTQAAVYRLAERDNVALLPSEWYEKGYEIYSPTYRIDPGRGIVSSIDAGPNRMRRGQSFAFDSSSGLIAATYAASHTLRLQAPGLQERWLSTLDFGVPNPRGCAILPGGRWLAISGNDNNLAIVDVAAGRLERLLGVPLGGHSHMFWLNT